MPNSLPPSDPPTDALPPDPGAPPTVADNGENTGGSERPPEQTPPPVVTDAEVNHRADESPASEATILVAPTPETEVSGTPDQPSCGADEGPASVNSSDANTVPSENPNRECIAPSDSTALDPAAHTDEIHHPVEPAECEAAEQTIAVTSDDAIGSGTSEGTWPDLRLPDPTTPDAEVSRVAPEDPPAEPTSSSVTVPDFELSSGAGESVPHDPTSPGATVSDAGESRSDECPATSAEVPDADVGDHEGERAPEEGTSPSPAPVPLACAAKGEPLPDPLAPPAAGRYQAYEFHKPGGASRVWRARDTELGRAVALKEIGPQFADDPHARSRFVFEAEVTGRLEHPAVIPVYGFGCDSSGRPYYAMRFVEGRSLQEAIAEFHATDGPSGAERVVVLRRLLGHFITVCRAVHYAHSRGVIHRALTPANIVVGAFGETLVVDWGNARRLRAAAGEPEAAPGPANTEPVAPEQVAGRSDLHDERTDVYGLGAILCAILTGSAAPPPGVHPEPLGARAQYPWLDGEIDRVMRQALAREPADRYPSAEAVAKAVEVWTADQPIAAQRAAVAELVRDVEAKPGDVDLVEELARERAHLGLGLSAMGRGAEAVEQFQTAVATFARLAQALGRPQLVAEQAATLLSLARCYERMGRTDDAKTARNESSQLYARLVVANPQERPPATSILSFFGAPPPVEVRAEPRPTAVPAPEATVQPAPQPEPTPPPKLKPEPAPIPDPAPARADRTPAQPKPAPPRAARRAPPIKPPAPPAFDPSEPLVKFRCSLCGRQMGIPASRMGKHVRCPRCQQVVLAPIIGAPAAPPAVPPAPPLARPVTEPEIPPFAELHTVKRADEGSTSSNVPIVPRAGRPAAPAVPPTTTKLPSPFPELEVVSTPPAFATPPEAQPTAPLPPAKAQAKTPAPPRPVLPQPKPVTPGTDPFANIVDPADGFPEQGLVTTQLPELPPEVRDAAPVLADDALASDDSPKTPADRKTESAERPVRRKKPAPIEEDAEPEPPPRRRPRRGEKPAKPADEETEIGQKTRGESGTSGSIFGIFSRWLKRQPEQPGADRTPPEPPGRAPKSRRKKEPFSPPDPLELDDLPEPEPVAGPFNFSEPRDAGGESVEYGDALGPTADGSAVSTDDPYDLPLAEPSAPSRDQVQVPPDTRKGGKSKDYDLRRIELPPNDGAVADPPQAEEVEEPGGVFVGGRPSPRSEPPPSDEAAAALEPTDPELDESDRSAEKPRPSAIVAEPIGRNTLPDGRDVLPVAEPVPDPAVPSAPDINTLYPAAGDDSDSADAMFIGEEKPLPQPPSEPSLSVLLPPPPEILRTDPSLPGMGSSGDFGPLPEPAGPSVPDINTLYPTPRKFPTGERAEPSLKLPYDSADSPTGKLKDDPPAKKRSDTKRRKKPTDPDAIAPARPKAPRSPKPPTAAPRDPDPSDEPVSPKAPTEPDLSLPDADSGSFSTRRAGDPESLHDLPKPAGPARPPTLPELPELPEVSDHATYRGARTPLRESDAECILSDLTDQTEPLGDRAGDSSVRLDKPGVGGTVTSSPTTELQPAPDSEDTTGPLDGAKPRPPRERTMPELFIEPEAARDRLKPVIGRRPPEPPKPAEEATDPKEPTDPEIETDPARPTVPRSSGEIEIADDDAGAKVRADLSDETAVEPPLRPAAGAAPPADGVVLPDGYTLLDELARGPLGVTYLARETARQRPVVIKTLPADLAGRPQALARFRREVLVTASLEEHPNIGRLLLSGTAPNGIPFMVLEHLEGTTLFDLLTARGAGWDKALLIPLAEVCSALHHAHFRGVVHRDVKLSNILVTPTGRAVLSDWGIAHAVPPGGPNPTAPAIPATPAAERFWGTPAYMAPEQARGELDRVGPRSDVFAVGANLLHLATGHDPAGDGSVQALFRSRGAGEIPRLRDLRPDAPAELDAICTRATAVRPEDRHQSAAALGSAIRTFLAAQAVRPRK